MKNIDMYITTPLYYVNSNPHIGHTYTTVVADIIKKYNKLRGKNVYFLTGTDEHGEKIAVCAEAAGKKTIDFVNDNSNKFRDIWDKLGIEYDDFIRTTEARHTKVVQYIIQKLYDTGDIYFDSYEGKYCVGCERFITDAELVDGKCPDHKVEPKIIKEENYFFKMSKYTEELKKQIEAKPEIIRPEWYRKEVLGYLKEKTEDLCISRPKSRVAWGIELPFDKNFVAYVWFDALINYISAVGYPENKDFNSYWDVAEHFIAKDILRTHTIYWGTMLLSMGLPLYKHLNVHGYWNMSGLKMSKSLGNVIEPSIFKDKYGDENLKFFFLKEMHWGEDSDFTIDRFVSKYNTDLANNYGNLISRTMGMVEKYYSNTQILKSKKIDDDHVLNRSLNKVIDSYVRDFPKYEFYKTMDLLWSLFDETNRFIAESKPWDLFKTGDMDKLTDVIIPVLEVLRVTTYLIYPIMPNVCTRILSQLGFKEPINYTFDDFTKWCGVLEYKTVYSEKKFFERMEDDK